MNCPQCGNELNIKTDDDHSNPTKSIEVIIECDECGLSRYTFLSVDDFIE
jgi:uncharacterized Zn finger protein